MSIFTEHFILSFKQAFNGTHQRTTLTSKVAGSLTLEGSFEHVSCTDTDTKGNGLFFCLATCILIYGVWAVQATTLTEHGTQTCSRTFGSNHNHVNIAGRNYARTITPIDGKSMWIVQGLARGEIFLDSGPCLYLSCIWEEHTDDCTFFCSFFNREKSLPWHPSISYSLVIGFACTLTNNHIETVVTQIACLTRTLNTIANHCDCFVFQHFVCLFQWKLFTGDYCLYYATKIHFCHNCFFV